MPKVVDVKLDPVALAILEYAASKESPMFDTEQAAHYLVRSGFASAPSAVGSAAYSKARYRLIKLEKLKLVYAYRVTNGGTVYLLRSRAKRAKHG